MNVEKLINKVKTLISRGKYEIAKEILLEELIDTEQVELKPLKNTLISISSRIENLNAKIRKGIISMEEFERGENLVVSSLLSFVDQLSSNLDHIQIPKIQQGNARSNKFIGTWKCNEIYPGEQFKTQIIWIINTKVEQTLFFNETSNRLEVSNEETPYSLIGNIHRTFYRNGKIGKGLIEWINNDCFLYTIIETDNHLPDLIGHKRIYFRIG